MGSENLISTKPPRPDLKEQSFVLPGPEKIHVSMVSKESALKDELYESFAFDDVRTIYDAIRRGLKQTATGQFLGWRPAQDAGYEWLSYETVLKRSVNFGRGLVHLGHKEKDFIGIYSKNRVEWVLTEQGLVTFSMTSVPLYDTLGPDACKFIINQTEISTVVVEDDEKVQTLLKDVPTSLKMIVHMEDLKPDTLKQAEAQGLTLHKFQKVEILGEENESSHPEKPPKPDDILTLSYTSGTTGTPKGVVITHKNLVAAAGSYYMNTRIGGCKLNRNDILISFLPLAHIYERIVEVVVTMTGGAIGFYRGDVLKLTEDLQWLKPTIFPCVPRLLNRVYDKVMAAARASLLKHLFIRMAVHFKGKEVRRGIFRRDSFWDFLVFKKIQNMLGGRIRIIISAGAPINGEIMHFFRCALGCIIMEAYGQTENTGAVTSTLPYEMIADQVGPPLACAALKLVDAPEMNYFAKDGQGEICVKGPNVSSGYFKNPEETQKTFGEDGWMYTGDIGMWLPNGVLKIIDRKKHIFKLSQGEYIAPEKIELIYTRCPFVSQIFVYGESLQSYLVGVVVPDPEYLTSVYPNQSLKALCDSPQVKTRTLEALNKLGKENGLKSFEQVKNIYLHPDPFTVEQDLLTPTMKSKRPELKKFFDKQLRQMYSDSPLSSGSF